MALFEFIITGLGSILGYELVVALCLIFSFLIMIVSRGAGITAMLGTFFLSIYLFSSYKIGDFYLLSNDWFLTVIILVGLLIGFLLYVLFWRE